MDGGATVGHSAAGRAAGLEEWQEDVHIVWCHMLVPFATSNGLEMCCTEDLRAYADDGGLFDECELLGHLIDAMGLAGGDGFALDHCE